MAREPVDDLLAELDAALQASPSPDAIARVRERVRQDANAPAPGSRWWLIAASVALVAAGATTMFMMMRREAPAAQTAVVAPKTVAPSLAPVGPPVTPPPSAPRTARAVPPSSDRPPRPEVVRASAPMGLPAVAHSAKAGPEVLVPPDEGEAIRRLLRAIRAGRATVPPAGAIEDGDGRLLEPKPIDIPLIKIEPLPGTPAAGVGGEEK